MIAPGRPVRLLGALAAAGLVGCGASSVGASSVGAAPATPMPSVASHSQDGQAPSVNDVEVALLERLVALDTDLPTNLDPVIERTAGETWATFDMDVTGVTATLTTLESDLRQLYADADDAAGPTPVAAEPTPVQPEPSVARAVADVARGWLDVHRATSVLQRWETNDLAFPADTRDDDGVATGRDELAGLAEAGFDQFLAGRARHLAGYAALRDLGVSLADEHRLLSARAESAAVFDADVRPVLVAVLGDPSTTILVPDRRFETSAPGVEARARSMTVQCVDRAAYEALVPPIEPDDVGGVAEATPQRADCTDLASADVRIGR